MRRRRGPLRAAAARRGSGRVGQHRAGPRPELAAYGVEVLHECLVAAARDQVDDLIPADLLDVDGRLGECLGGGRPPPHPPPPNGPPPHQRPHPPPAPRPPPPAPRPQPPTDP